MECTAGLKSVNRLLNSVEARLQAELLNQHRLPLGAEKLEDPPSIVMCLYKNYLIALNGQNTAIYEIAENGSHSISRSTAMTSDLLLKINTP